MCACVCVPVCVCVVCECVCESVCMPVCVHMCVHYTVSACMYMYVCVHGILSLTVATCRICSKKNCLKKFLENLSRIHSHTSKKSNLVLYFGERVHSDRYTQNDEHKKRAVIVLKQG